MILKNNYFVNNLKLYIMTDGEKKLLGSTVSDIVEKNFLLIFPKFILKYVTGNPENHFVEIP